MCSDPSATRSNRIECPRMHTIACTGVPVSTLGLSAHEATSKCLLGKHGTRKLRCVGCPGERRELDLAGGNGVILAGKW